MVVKVDYVQTVTLYRCFENTVKFAENLQLTCSMSNRNFSNEWYDIKDVKGDFVITKISINFSDGSKWNNTYDKEKNQFKSSSESVSATFYITANITEFYFDLQIPSTRFLKLNRFLKKKFVLPYFDGLKFTYYVKKIKATGENDIETVIENPYNIQIQGKKGDFKTEISSTETKLTLLFGFCPEDSGESNIAVDETPESPQAVAIVESRPESVIPTDLSSHATVLLQKLHSSNRYSDVYFVASDGKKIPSHRNILAEFSDIFARIFDETSELPVQITVDDFNAETIQSAVNFLYDKNDAIKGNEVEVFKFAVKFGIQSLIDACCSFFEESVSPANVCEFIQIAYLHNFAALKQKCLKILVEKKKEIYPSKVDGLPHNIVVDAFFF